MSSGSQLVPFTYSLYKNTPISSLEFYGNYVFAGVSNVGMVIRSKNRYSWEKFYKTSDTNISAMKIDNDYLYIGTSPEGNVYRINMLTLADTPTLSTESFGSLGSEIVDFGVFNGELYVAVNSPTAILKLNQFTDAFDFVYTPYSHINQMAVMHGKIYLVLEASNIVTFDGTTWSNILMDNKFTNISSYRHISKEVYSYANAASIDRSSIIHPYDLTDEEMLSIMPLNKSSGVSQIVQDGTSVVMGSSNFARVYRLLDDDLKMIFNTEGQSIDNIINIEVGTSLVASSNKVYLMYSGNVTGVETTEETTEETSTTVTEAENVDEGKSIVVTYPNGGEEIIINTEVNIQWSSTKGVNDAIKIELMKGNEVSLVINNRTSNVGTYTWEVPISMELGDYKIRITWLAAGDTSPENYDESNDTFSIVNAVTTTTTTTTQAIDPLRPDTSSTRGIPILVLPEYETITKMAVDNKINGVLFATSNGRILKCDTLTINGYLTGDRLVYADVYDGCGYEGSAETVFNYALYKKLVEINENKAIQNWKYDTDITGIKQEKVTAVFTGPVVNIRNDFGFWTELSWEEIKPSGSEITIYLRSSTTEQDLLEKPWEYSTTSTVGEVGVITRNLNNAGLKGKYLQVKVEMEVNIMDVVPSVTDITVKYSSRNSSYFFTNKFSIGSTDPAKKGLLTATISQPSNTEIQFGISSDNTVAWNEYQLITPDKLFDLNNEEFRVGIKFTSYYTSLPQVSEFALMAGGEVLTRLNS